ncbi:MAG: hypothetical protein ACRDQA_04430 [Nocardioidaceae bacterium]
MASSRLSGVTYFADENALGLAKLLIRSGRDDVVHPGHGHLPEVPLGTPDLDWMPLIARANLIVLSRDRRIRTRPAERTVHRELGLRSVWIGGKQDLRPIAQLELFLKYEQQLQRFALKHGPGPWAVVMSTSGVRAIRGSGADV